MRLLEDSLAEEILSGRIKEGDTAVVDIDENAQVVVSQSLTSRELLPQGAES
jgi:ATP-dependent Clp protease ATP-binding subunit ClpC